jgi:hypothetical protein
MACFSYRIDKETLSQGPVKPQMDIQPRTCSLASAQPVAGLARTPKADNSPGTTIFSRKTPGNFSFSSGEKAGLMAGKKQTFSKNQQRFARALST